MENDSARCFGKRAKPRSRRRQRTYSLQICVPPLDGCAWEVVESIERQTIPVTDARDYNALDDVTDASGAILVDNDVKLSVPVTEWLAVGCQRIRWEGYEENALPEGICGMFRSNGDVVFGRPDADFLPIGPSAFVGEIVLSREIQRAWQDCRTRKETADLVETFQFIVAHELVHVFDMLKYLVPAFLDWHAFWDNVLHQGSSLDLWHAKRSYLHLFIDDYGAQSELARIRAWWPSSAESWFRARSRDWSQLSKKARL